MSKVRLYVLLKLLVPEGHCYFDLPHVPYEPLQNPDGGSLSTRCCGPRYQPHLPGTCGRQPRCHRHGGDDEGGDEVPEGAAEAEQTLGLTGWTEREQQPEQFGLSVFRPMERRVLDRTSDVGLLTSHK